MERKTKKQMVQEKHDGEISALREIIKSLQRRNVQQSAALLLYEQSVFKHLGRDFVCDDVRQSILFDYPHKGATKYTWREVFSIIHDAGVRQEISSRMRSLKGKGECTGERRTIDRTPIRMSQACISTL